MLLPVHCTGVSHPVGRMRVFATDKLDSHQRKINSLQLPGYNKARLSPVQPKNDWEKHTLGQNGADFQTDSRRKPSRCSTANSQVRTPPQTPLQHMENGTKHGVTLAAVHQDLNLSGRDQQYFLNYMALELRNNESSGLSLIMGKVALTGVQCLPPRDAPRSDAGIATFLSKSLNHT